jgi:death-on-curing protein
VPGQKKSIEAIIARIDNRIAFGVIRDIHELAACCACCIAVGHAFHDANKRTAFACMDTCLALNGIELSYDTAESGDLMVRAARGIVDETALATWLRQLYINQSGDKSSSYLRDISEPG